MRDQSASRYGAWRPRPATLWSRSWKLRRWRSEPRTRRNPRSIRERRVMPSRAAYAFTVAAKSSDSSTVVFIRGSMLGDRKLLLTDGGVRFRPPRAGDPELSESVTPTPAGRYLLSAGFALPRDAGRRPAVQAVPALLRDRRYAIPRPSGPEVPYLRAIRAPL